MHVAHAQKFITQPCSTSGVHNTHQVFKLTPEKVLSNLITNSKEETRRNNKITQ